MKINYKSNLFIIVSIFLGVFLLNLALSEYFSEPEYEYTKHKDTGDRELYEEIEYNYETLYCQQHGYVAINRNWYYSYILPSDFKIKRDVSKLFKYLDQNCSGEIRFVYLYKNKYSAIDPIELGDDKDYTLNKLESSDWDVRVVLDVEKHVEDKKGFFKSF